MSPAATELFFAPALVGKHSFVLSVYLFVKFLLQAPFCFPLYRPNKKTAIEISFNPNSPAALVAEAACL